MTSDRTFSDSLSSGSAAEEAATGRADGCVVCGRALGTDGAGVGTVGLGVVGLFGTAACAGDEVFCPVVREGPPAPCDAAGAEAVGTLGATTGALPAALEAGVEDRPSAGLAAWRLGGVVVTGEGNPRPAELNSSMTSHFSSLITISGFKSGRCRRILTSTFPPVALRVEGSMSYKQ